MSTRKSNRFTERRIFPYVREEHLLIKELMPLVRKMAVNRTGGHPWGEMSDMEIMKNAGLYEQDFVTGEKGFNLAAILLFGRDEAIRQAAPGYVTDCLLRIHNMERYDDREQVECNLIQAFDKCRVFIRKHTNDPFFLIDSLNVSVRDHIAKEFVSNLLVHREFSGMFPARIIVKKDRIVGENWNRSLRPGRIDPANYEPFPKNPILAHFFVQIGYADKLGSGVRNLYRYTNMYSKQEPELIEGDVFRTIVPLPKVWNGDGIGDANGDGTITDNITVHIANNETQARILSALQENPSLTITALSKLIGISGRNIKQNIKRLKEASLLERVGSNRRGKWIVKE
jgi:ATP-dependent DNA helicase RecG